MENWKQHSESKYHISSNYSTKISWKSESKYQINSNYSTKINWKRCNATHKIKISRPIPNIDDSIKQQQNRKKKVKLLKKDKILKGNPLEERRNGVLFLDFLVWALADAAVTLLPLWFTAIIRTKYMYKWENEQWVILWKELCCQSTSKEQ